MACFLVPVAEAVITTTAAAVFKKKGSDGIAVKLGWLNKMLWGGSALLAFEHIWHGEIIPEFPFLTAVKTGETVDMLKEMGTNGVGMALLVTVVWVIMVAVSSALAKKQVPAESEAVT